jgi:dephospho-CoA kinase
MVIGLTGTIGSGKSLVAEELKRLGAVIIDTDLIAREVVEPGTLGWRAVVHEFGRGILREDKTIDRQKLGGVVFADKSRLLKLNLITHPLIGAETARRLAMAPRGKHVVLVVPLLFESGFDKLAKNIWVVTAGGESLVERIMERDSLSREESLKRIGSQMAQKEKTKRADVVIDNSGTIEETLRQVREAWKKISI